MLNKITKLRLEPEDHLRLVELASKNKATRTKIVRKALLDYLNEQELIAA
jgi:predicted transcriptional regulator